MTSHIFNMIGWPEISLLFLRGKTKAKTTGLRQEAALVFRERVSSSTKRGMQSCVHMKPFAMKLLDITSQHAESSTRYMELPFQSGSAF